MGISVSTVATTRRLTSRTRIDAELGVTVSASLSDALNDQASAAIEAYCNQAFARETLTETLGGYDDIHLQLGRTPVVAVSSVSFDGDSLTDYSIANAQQGLLYRRGGWQWTAQARPGLSGWQSWPGMGVPIGGREEPLYSVTYTAGYILPSQHILAQTTISAAAADNSFNDSASGFPALLKAGDIVQVSGFATAANNGRFVVSGTPTTSKIVVTGGTLVLEAAGPSVSVLFQPPGGVRPCDDLEKAALEAIKTWYLTRADDGNVIEKQLGQARVRYSDVQKFVGLPAQCVGLLRPWVRRA